MKKTAAILISLLIISQILAGCSNQKSSNSQAPSSSSEVNRPKPGGDSPNSGGTIVLKAASANPPESGHAYGLRKWKELVEQRTSGKVQIEIFGDGVLGDEEQLAEGLRMGTIDAIVTSTAKYANFVPEMDILSAPYTFKNWEHYKDVVHGPIIAKLGEFSKQRRGDILMGILTDGVRNVYSRKEYKSFEEMRDIKLRVMTGPVESMAWKALGVQPVPLAYAELYPALQTGVVDAAENTMAALKNMKFYESCKYVYRTEHNFLALLFLINQKALGKVPAEYRDVLIQAGKDTSKWQIDFSIQQNASFEKELADKFGVKINEVTKEQKEYAMKKMFDVQDEVAKRIKVENLMKEIRDDSAKY